MTKPTHTPTRPAAVAEGREARMDPAAREALNAALKKRGVTPPPTPRSERRPADKPAPKGEPSKPAPAKPDSKLGA